MRRSDTRRSSSRARLSRGLVGRGAARTAATLSEPGHTGQRFAATVEESAGVVRANSGSTLIQLVMQNPAERVLPGSFAVVHFQLPADNDALRVPAGALVFDRQGMRVGTVGAGDRIVFTWVTIVHDFGNSVEIGRA